MTLLWAIPSVAVVVVALVYQKLHSLQPQNAVYVIGDLHGDVECALHWVNKTKLIRNHKWLDSSSFLVFLGDYIDKGPTSRQTVEFVKILTEKYPQQVTALLGNHEVELLRDRSDDPRRWGKGKYFQLAYAATHPGEYLNYLDEVDSEDEIVVDALYNASLEVYSQNQHNKVFMLPNDDEILQYIPTRLRQLVKEQLKVYQELYLDAYRTGTPLGTWLEERPILTVAGGALFVHGGVSRRASYFLREENGGVDHLNDIWKNHSTKDKINTFLDTTPEGQAIYEMLTFRGNHNDEACPYLPRLLPEGVTRLGVGHTPGYNVKFKCDGNFLALDSSLGRYFRNSGNEYCRGDKLQRSSNGRYTCRKMDDKCQGQIIRIMNGVVELIE
jgi:predicted MPP superfamily phosphohydrolase